MPNPDGSCFLVLVLPPITGLLQQPSHLPMLAPRTCLFLGLHYPTSSHDPCEPCALPSPWRMAGSPERGGSLPEVTQPQGVESVHELTGVSCRNCYHFPPALAPPLYLQTFALPSHGRVPGAEDIITRPRIRSSSPVPQEWWETDARLY